MNKEIEKLQHKLSEAKSERVRAEVRYNTHVVILDGNRKMLRELEVINQQMLAALMESEKVVGEFNLQLQKKVEEETIKSESDENQDKKN